MKTKRNATTNNAGNKQGLLFLQPTKQERRQAEVISLACEEKQLLATIQYTGQIHCSWTSDRCE